MEKPETFPSETSEPPNKILKQDNSVQHDVYCNGPDCVIKYNLLVIKIIILDCKL